MSAASSVWTDETIKKAADFVSSYPDLEVSKAFKTASDRMLSGLQVHVIASTTSGAAFVPVRSDENTELSRVLHERGGDVLAYIENLEKRACKGVKDDDASKNSGGGKSGDGSRSGSTGASGANSSPASTRSSGPGFTKEKLSAFFAQ